MSARNNEDVTNHQRAVEPQLYDDEEDYNDEYDDAK